MASALAERWLGPGRATLLELFVLLNLAGLAPDIYLAHSVNRFRAPVEWLPFAFSLLAPPALALGLWLRRRGREAPGRLTGLVVGALSIAVGLGGALLHLESQFFQRQTIHELVYTAPFAAPLAYAGLGFLLLLNRMVPAHEEEWARWVLFLTVAGCCGDLALALCDHAQNGFFHPSEWLAVAASALAIGFLGVALYERGRAYLLLTLGVLGLQAGVGALGFALHLRANLDGPGALWQRFLYGAPAFAPLLFVDLALLGALGIGALLVPAKGPDASGPEASGPDARGPGPGPAEAGEPGPELSPASGPAGP
ncbi:MAG: hypothetical protein AB7N76_36785 [Planctomycetota bacterium]